MNPLPAITTAPRQETTSRADAPIQGSALVLMQFDVAEEIRLDDLRHLLDARRAETTLKHPAPTYVRFQRPPVVESLETQILESGEKLEAQIKYYDYGVVSVVFELPFEGDWERLVHLASRWEWDTDFESRAWKIAKEKLKRAEKALVKPYAVSYTHLTLPTKRIV